MKRKPTDSAFTVDLAYQPPLAWKALLDFMRLRAIPGVEAVEENTYQRSIEINGGFGFIQVMPAKSRPYLIVRMQLPANTQQTAVIDRVRRIFDIDADPKRIIKILKQDPILKPAVRAAPGLRVPSGWDPFELAVRAVLGQQISVKAASTVAGRIAQRFGEPVIFKELSKITHAFPRPEILRNADLSAIGLTTARAQTIRDLAAASCDGKLPDSSCNGLEAIVKSLTAIRGIGKWTAQYIAMRAFGERDAFPEGDLGLRHSVSRSKSLISSAELSRIAERWRPWRAYACMYLWSAKRP